MNKAKTRCRAQASGSTIQEEIWLLGQATLRHYLEFIEDTAVGGAKIDRTKLTDEWRVANDQNRKSESRETGIVYKAKCRELLRSSPPLATWVKPNPHDWKTLFAPRRPASAWWKLIGWYFLRSI
jgi:hypothetical protein